MTDASSAGMADSMPSDDVAAATTEEPQEPTSDRPRQHAAWQLRVQARSCAAMGSPLYDHLLTHAATDCAHGGPTWAVLRDHVAPGRGDALALRLMAAVHRLVLESRAPRLASFYPSVGGSGAIGGVWEAFQATVEEHRDTLVTLVDRPCQTNEVGRSAALLVGLFAVARETELPLRLLEVGASAGLNLRCDRFLVGGGGVVVGDPDSPVDLSSHWRTPPPWTPTPLVVVDRRGCDPEPVDPATSDGRLTLMSSVWADQPARHDRLRGALALAALVPAVVDRASLDVWSRAQLRELPAGVTTVVFHSVVLEYVDAAARSAFVEALTEAATRAAADRPLAWVRLEPVDHLRHHGVQVDVWPGDAGRTLARCGAHGTAVTWLDDDSTAACG
jgi:hypothetical protein